MRLKKIRLAGFKSFVDPTNIPFPGDMTAIVGPNGCGKSNVIDAVRWVLGESSAKNLRGDAMTDVIFNGSNSRKAMGQCSVELVFDNSSGRIQGEFAAFNEISVKRLVTKEAVSSYFLNGAKCRRKDITDLFLGTGLGPRSYAIIEQGMISKLIESKPQELRVFIEEAAGISKYKERRKETQTRIKHTKENLDRLEDVRQELGDQINKLKRQASAANRFKELKAQERTLKGELATIKWLEQSEKMSDINKDIAQKQTELQDLLANLEGDDNGLQALKNKQAIYKQNIQDEQQSLFKLGTEITRLEQSQLYAQKRANQIQSEIEQIRKQETSLDSVLRALNTEIDDTEDKVLELEPERSVVDEQLFEAESNKLDVDEKLQKLIRENKQLDDLYYNKKQELQQKHSQIQQTLSLQQRTETRIEELEQEANESQDHDLQQNVQELDIKLQEIGQQLSAKSDEVNIANQTAETNKQTLNEHEKALQELHNKRASIEGKLETLIALQEESSSNADGTDALSEFSPTPVWQYFQVQAGYEKALQSGLLSAQDGQIVQSGMSSIIDLVENSSPTLMFEQSFTNKKRAGTLAEKITNPLVPYYFNQILLAENPQQALELIPKVDPSDTQYDASCILVIDLAGTIYSFDRIISVNQHDNKILRAAQIEELNIQTKALAESIVNSERLITHSSEQLRLSEQVNENLKTEYETLKNQIAELNLKKQNVEFQLEQTKLRKSKLLEEIKTQQESLEQEEMALELLNEQVEILSESLLETEEQRSTYLSQNDSLQQQQQSLQILFNQLQKKSHEQAMQIQQLQNSLKILQQQFSNKKQQQAEYKEKLVLLLEESEELLMPKEEQEGKLQDLLSKQEKQRIDLQTLQEQLNDIENDINELEKGRSGFTLKIDRVKSEIESYKIQMESANVRAQSFIEQLQESKQSVKEILETLPDEANAEQWQTELDKTVNNIARLGAVNLAAVDEYEEQFERKQHLDEQNKDLSDALETLEQAMRKIDKETRTRFKTTYDKVNGDLKSLFPKVFGGGSAYLDLTGDDLLETGVTIMARPPGKKNSTIQLLSGGEKALTALSLVFAIFRLNPAPFCLLDEVDAPLDDANVGRFCRLVSEMSETVQFIYITHNKVAMEMATHLTGVTMAEPGVSRMVAVDMEQALAIAE